MRTRLTESLDLPLLRRELIEASRRPRLWIVRSLLALGCGLFLLLHYSDLHAFGSPAAAVSAFGRGSELADIINVLSLVILYLLLPITACAAFASERERQTLPLLLISRISPSRLVAEKLLSSMVLVVVLVLLNLPPLALAYALGGLSPPDLASQATVLLIAAFQINTVALFWSAVFNTSLRAFWATLITLVAFFFGPAALCIALYGTPYGSFLGADLQSLFTAFWESKLFTAPLQDGLLAVLPPLLCGCLFLIGTVLVITNWRWNAPVEGRISPLRALTHWLRTRRHTQPATSDAALRELQKSSAEPIAWRELHSASGPRIWPYIAAALAMPLAFLFLTSSTMHFSSETALVTLKFVLIVSGLLILLASGSAPFCGERERQTLSILLTTPLPTRSIVLQKLAGVRRHRTLIIAVVAVLLTQRALLSQWAILPNRFAESRQVLTTPLATEAFNLAIIWEHFTLTLWIAAAWSLASRTTLRASIGTLTTLLAYAFLHFLAMFIVFEILGSELREIYSRMLPMLPGVALIVAIVNELPVQDDYSRRWLLLSPILFGLAIATLRHTTLRLAPRWLQR
jgi:ABC-type transport system involved in multi-copper enzyme maturation permease subunit